MRTRLLRLLTALALMALVLPPSTALAQRLPAAVCTTLHAERAKYGAAPTSAELGQILNATAWTHRADTWGLSGKTVGSRCPGPSGQDVACDILHRRTDGLIWDVLVAAGAQATPLCVDALGSQTDPARPWIAPVDPGGGEPPPPPPLPTDDLNAIRAALDALAMRVDGLVAPVDQARAESYNAAVRALEIQAALRQIDAQVEAAAKSLEEHRAEVKKVKSWAQKWLVEKILPVLGGVVAGWIAK